MDYLIIVFFILVIFFCGVLLFGAPYLPTLSSKVDEALDLLDLQPGQRMLELGCGDGRLLVAAAKKGIYSVGYELNPLLYAYACIRTWRYRSMVSVRFGDYWRKQWPEADGIYVFLLQSYMSKLHKNVVQYSKGRSVVLVSFAFEITDKKCLKEQNGMFLYKYSGKE